MYSHSTTVATACLAFGLAAGPQGCVVDVGGSKYEAVRVEKRFAVSGVPDLALTTFDGAIEVRAWDRNEIAVEIEKRGADRAEVDAIEVVAQQSGDRVSIDVRKPPRANVVVQIGTSPSARLVATVPRHCNLTARSGDGPVTIERLAGRIDADTGDGSIHASDVEGSFRGHTGDGSVRVVSLNGTADVDSGDGTVVLSGRLSKLRLRTGDGSVAITLDAGSALEDDWEVRTGDGGITIGVPDAFAAELDADAGSGRVRVDRAVADTGDEGHRSRLRANLGGGGKRFMVRTGDGSIVVKRS